MINKIVAIQGNHPSELNPRSDTSIFLAIEAQNRNYKIFYYEPEHLSIIKDKVIATGYFVEFSYVKNNFYKINKKLKLDLFNISLFSKPFFEIPRSIDDQCNKSLPINSVLKPFLGASR